MLKKVITQYRSAKPEVKSSFWFIIASMFQKGMMAITIPIFTRIMSAAEFGKFMVYMSWYEIVIIFATLNFFAGVYNNAMIKYEDHRSEYTSAIQSLSFLCTLVLYGVYLIFQGHVNLFTGLDTTLTTLMFLQILFIPAFYFWSARERFERRYVTLVIATMLMSVIGPLLGIVMVVTADDKVLARVWAAMATQVFFGLVFAIIQYRKGKVLFNKSYWRFALAFNVPLIPHYLSMIVLNNSDRILIDRFVGADKAGIYSLAYSASMLTLIFIQSINASFVPWTYRKMKEQSYEIIGKYAAILLVITGVIIIGLISVAPEVVQLLAPAEYYEAIWIIPPVALSAYFIFVYMLFANIEFFFEENYFVLIASLIAGISNIGLNWVLIPRFGYIVAGYTTLFTYVMFGVMHYVFMRITLTKRKIEHVYDARVVLVISALVVLAGMSFLLVYEHSYIRYTICFVLFLAAILFRNRILGTLRELKN